MLKNVAIIANQLLQFGNPITMLKLLIKGDFIMKFSVILLGLSVFSGALAAKDWEAHQTHHGRCHGALECNTAHDFCHETEGAEYLPECARHLMREDRVN